MKNHTAVQHYEEESPKLLQQVDGINDSDVERPGKVEMVTGEPQVEEDGGGWVVFHTQRKSRERKVAAGGEGSRMGSLERMFRTLLKLKSAT